MTNIEHKEVSHRIAAGMSWWSDEALLKELTPKEKTEDFGLKAYLTDFHDQKIVHLNKRQQHLKLAIKCAPAFVFLEWRIRTLGKHGWVITDEFSRVPYQKTTPLQVEFGKLVNAGNLFSLEEHYKSGTKMGKEEYSEINKGFFDLNVYKHLEKTVKPILRTFKLNTNEDMLLILDVHVYAVSIETWIKEMKEGMDKNDVGANLAIIYSKFFPTATVKQVYAFLESVKKGELGELSIYNDAQRVREILENFGAPRDCQSILYKQRVAEDHLSTYIIISDKEERDPAMQAIRQAIKVHDLKTLKENFFYFGKDASIKTNIQLHLSHLKEEFKRIKDESDEADVNWFVTLDLKVWRKLELVFRENGVKQNMSALVAQIIFYEYEGKYYKGKEEELYRSGYNPRISAVEAAKTIGFTVPETVDVSKMTSALEFKQHHSRKKLAELAIEYIENAGGST